ncbi:MAG: adenine phosphoribosyltransferase [Lentisphaerae bacterium RIFOXYA12_FULL_48_11]|nr:MAG: adenine phosphoribosyltransferase [Lentisphaerae bacterium RIFOXYA12_FULL_48_11]
MDIKKVKAAIRDVPDFPKPGIIFKDITPVLSDPKLFKAVIDLFVKRHKGKRISKIAAIDARGFLFGGAMAERLGVGLVPIRKKGKLPYKTYEETYDLEYGTATISIHQDAFKKGERVVLIDDLLATGGTAAAAAKLIEKAGGKVVEIDFLVELGFLKGRGKLKGYKLFAPIKY